MSERLITKARAKGPEPARGKTDWEQLKSLTDEEIRAAARADPDNPPLTGEEIARIEPIPDSAELGRSSA